MPHTNTIEALTLEIDRVNNLNRILKKAAEDALGVAESWIHDQLDGIPGSLESALAKLDSVREAIQKAESR